MNKTSIVAWREYMENLSTKTFWIGIFFLPVLLILSIAVPFWLEKAKDVRRYAVVDASGWLLPAVEEKASSPDLAKVFRLAVERFRQGGKEFEKLPEVLQKIAPLLAKLPEEKLDLAAAAIAAFQGPDKPPLPALPIGQEEIDKALEGFQEPIRQWWRALPPQEAARLAPGTSKTRYAAIDATELGKDAAERINRLNDMLADDRIFAYFTIGKDPVEDSSGCKYLSRNLTDEGLKNWFSSLASSVVQERRLAQKKIDPLTAKWIQEPLRFEAKTITETGAEEKIAGRDTARQWAPVVFVYLLWIAVFTIAQMLLSNTIEEKSNRMIEVLLSSISPLQLMSGKIAGIAATGLTILGAWAIFFLATIKSLPLFFKEMPDFDILSVASEPLYIGSFLVYFLLGYLFYAALLVGIGSVCNSLKESQNLMLPITLLLFVPLMAMVPISQDPNGSLARVLSFFPPFTPFIMMNRAAGPPAAWEYAATTALLIASIAAAFWAAGKIFRIGILMTGKPPRMREILQWIKAPVYMQPPPPKGR